MDTRRLDRLCGAFRARLRALMFQAGACRLITQALVLLPLFLALDWWAHLGALTRCLTLGVYLLALGATAWWTLLAPLGRKWSNPEVLAYLDTVLPGERAMLLELYQLIRGEGIQEGETPAGREMIEKAVADMEPLVQQAAGSRTLYRRRAMTWLKTAAIAAALVAAVAVPLQLTGGGYVSIGLERFFNPFSQRRWPHRTTIKLHEPKNGWTIPQMESFTIEGQVSGQVVPPQVTLAYKSKTTGYWIKEKVAVRDDGSLKYTFPEVREEIRFQVTGGDYETDYMTIKIVERPFLRKILADYDYPDYAGIPDRKVEGGQLVGLEGTKVKLSFESSMALNKVVMKLRLKQKGKAGAEKETSEELPLSGGGKKFSKEFYLIADGSYSIELYEVNGFREAKPERYEIRVTPDNPPEVELLAPGRNLIATKRATVEVALKASDDFGLKTVEFMWSLDDGKSQPLTDRVTGPLAPKGKSKRASFTWDLRKMKDLPKTGVITYSVRVKDVNPAPGRGLSETAAMEIKLVSPSQFHFDLFEQAKRIEAEARIAWENQYAAWVLGGEWLRKGSGKEEDQLWRDMKEKQELAIRASRAMENYLLDLTEQYEKNGMQRDFMAGRLAVITELLRHVTGTEHPAIAEGLRRARPKTDADAAPARLKGLRGSQVKKFSPNQKLATLYLERLVKRLFDWRDLQTTLIRTTLLHEEQEEVLGITQKLAPKTLGQELEDLPDDVQDELITLGKRQRTLFDVESELEKELEFQIHRAEQQQRKSILASLRGAYKGLRNNGVNSNLKVAAKKIENNQSFQIIKNQKSALQVLSLVKGGLIYAGQKVDPEPKITLAMTPSKILDVQPKTKVEDPGEEPVEVAGTGEVEALTPEELLANLPVGSDPITMAINVAWEAQDAVRARTAYLHDNSAGEMPRYVTMKQGILLEKQAMAIRVLDLALKQTAKGKGTPQPVGQSLKIIRGELDQSRQLIAKRVLGKPTQQLQSDSMESLDDLRRRYIPMQKSVAEEAEENRKRKGLDAFNRKYLVRGKDLDATVMVIDKLNHLQLLERDALRKVKRFAAHPGKPGLLADMEKGNRLQAASSLGEAIKLLSEVKSAAAGMSPEVVTKVKETGVGPLVDLEFAALSAGVKAGGRDKELTEPLEAAASLVESTLSALKDLLGERVKPKIAKTAGESEKAPTMTLEQWEKMRTPEYLRAQLKNNKNLPPEVREIMLKALSRKFPEKYKDLLANYYASFISGGGEKKPGEEGDKGGTEKKEDAK
jgi:hypothetical protein